MSKCVNENCNKDPMTSLYAVLATADGDFACCKKCLGEYKKQKDIFFKNIDNDEWYERWLNA